MVDSTNYIVLEYEISECTSGNLALMQEEIYHILKESSFSCNLQITTSATFNPFVDYLSFVRLLVGPAAFMYKKPHPGRA